MEKEIETGWEWREHNRTKVLACLKEGEYEAMLKGALEEIDCPKEQRRRLGLAWYLHCAFSSHFDFRNSVFYNA